MTPLTEIENYFKDYDFNEDEIVIDKATKITNLKNFVDSHIKILKGNKGNRRFLPYYDRLHKVYLITKI